jgi:hypothetical protein
MAQAAVRAVQRPLLPLLLLLLFANTVEKVCM